MHEEQEHLLPLAIRVKEKMADAPDADHVRTIEAELGSITMAFLNGEKAENREAREAKFRAEREDVNKGVLPLKSAEEFREALKIAYQETSPEGRPDEAKEREAEELAHYLRARAIIAHYQEQGWVIKEENYPRLNIHFFTDGDGKLTFNTSTAFVPPAGLDDETKRELIRDVALAPAFSDDFADEPVHVNWRKRLRRLGPDDRKILKLGKTDQEIQDLQKTVRYISLVQEEHPNVRDVSLAPEALGEQSIGVRMVELATDFGKKPWNQQQLRL